MEVKSYSQGSYYNMLITFMQSYKIVRIISKYVDRHHNIYYTYKIKFTHSSYYIHSSPHPMF